MNSYLPVVLAIAAVVVIGLLMRRASGQMPIPPSDRSPEEGVAPSREDELGDQLDDFVEDDVEAVAVTSDGHAFLPDLHAVRIMPPAEGDEDEPWARGSDEAGRARHRRGEAAISMSLHAGDLTDARVVRGGADEGPFRLEAMGRDGEYQCWSFETREGADAACSLLELRGVVHRGKDDDDQPMRHSREAWDEARRIWEEIRAEVALDLDDDDPAVRKPE